MTRNKLFAWAVALAAALPFAAVAEDAPGVFKIPGTETTLKIYGFARFDFNYDLNQLNGWPSDLLNANISDYAGAAETDPTGDPELVKMTAVNSRFGFTTVTPSDVGPIEVKVEGDFASNFRLRHGYGTINNTVLIGQTWSTWRDGSAQVDTLDWGGNQTSGGGRRPQIRAMFKAGTASISLAAENPSNDLGGPTQLPDFVGSVSIPMSWGHVSLRGVVVPLKDAVNSSMGYGASLGSHLDLGGDTLIFEVMAGSGIASFMDFLGNESRSALDTGSSIVGWQAVSASLGFTHLWTPAIRSNIILTGGVTKNDQDLMGQVLATDGDGNPTKFGWQSTQNAIQGFVNVIYSVGNNCELGLEYTWGQKTDFAKNKYVLSRIAAAATYNFF